MALVLLMSTGCGHRSILRERPNKAQEFAFDQDEIAQSFASDLELPALPPTTPKLRTGMWVTLSVREPNGRPIEFRKYKVLKATPLRVFLEVEIKYVTRSLPDITYYQIENYPLTYRIDSTEDELKSIFSRVRLRKRIYKNEEFDPVETPPIELRDTPNFLHEILFIGARRPETNLGLRMLPCRVGRIFSKKCSLFSSKVDLPEETSKWDVIAHPSIPLLQFLQKSDPGEVQTVIQFGHSGADSELLRKKHIPDFLK